MYCFISKVVYPLEHIYIKSVYLAVYFAILLLGSIITSCGFEPLMEYIFLIFQRLYNHCLTLCSIQKQDGRGKIFP